MVPRLPPAPVRLDAGIADGEEYSTRSEIQTMLSAVPVKKLSYSFIETIVVRERERKQSYDEDLFHHL